MSWAAVRGGKPTKKKGGGGECCVVPKQGDWLARTDELSPHGVHVGDGKRVEREAVVGGKDGVGDVPGRRAFRHGRDSIRVPVWCSSRVKSKKWAQ